MYEFGETTSDLHDLGIPHPTETTHQLPHSEREQQLRRNGALYRRTGITLITADALAILTLMALPENAIWNNPTHRQLILLAVLLTGFTATALLTVGLLERQGRQTRTLIRRAMARADTNADLGDANRAAIDANRAAIMENTKLVAEAIITLTGIEKRLHALETAVEAVPGYADGLARGARVAASVLGIDPKED
ncbi:hypothetical protein FHR83_006822 [Actinoplanes campanulatus]|uniref:Uncharacterized protein n=1 Tax=Actinoplanes campanulatus TaxID=113559 RepID=A0A7W5FHX8_9ACTN|nr:hypothetical protein [Actinoplanes campanulatus]MBB3099116.1 hypothetical protein [Actinoplanes campanulatus]GGN38968.1 hypothetical protein GCM10010109_66370 [Actinoplanes campanulatus]GID40272.1 hypothetical protein Aca09nite_67780 [Actinoplanes campanulatus]